MLITHIVRLGQKRNRPGWSFHNLLSLRRGTLTSTVSLFVLDLNSFKFILFFVDLSDNPLLPLQNEVDFARNFGRVVLGQRTLLVAFVLGVPGPDFRKELLRG